MNRNAPCPCGSGKRYKHCCGASADAAGAPLARDRALEAHRSGALSRAEALYRAALQDNAEDFDALHMLGVVQMQRLRHREALESLWEAAERTRWALPQIRHNLGLVLARLLTGVANDELITMQARFAAWQETRRHERTDARPLVSVIVPTHNDRAHATQTIASVLAQTYRPIELIVIDDGSTDGTAAAIRECVDGAPLSVRLVAREHRGLAATLNEGAELAQGAYVAFASSGDSYAPERLARLVDEVANAGGTWGFSLVSGVRVDANAEPEGFDAHRQRQLILLGKGSNSFSLLTENVSMATGNLFVEREFFRALGGFRDSRDRLDWDFCLRAANLAEPVVVREPLYFYRVHEGNTVDRLRQRVLADTDHVLGDFLATTLSDAVSCPNPLAPQWPGSRRLLLKEVMGDGLGALIPPPMLREVAAELRARPPEQRAARRTSPSGARKTALVVLGMHRSGTSALTRVLNLCGAFLPSNLRPPKADVNAKGFWEPEEVVELNERTLQQLRAGWNQARFTLPTEGDVVTEFVNDACEMLASAYGDEETILLKDPRIGILAPLWDRALLAAGYRPIYVVPVRNPMEVARSLHARGDMTVREGLALCLTYMTRIAEFADAHHDVVYVSFDELFEDWRGQVRRIAERFGIHLDARGREGEVAAFLEPALRRQVSDQAELDALPDEPDVVAVRAAYREALARCARDAEVVPGRAAAVPAAPRSVGVANAPPATACFVLCIENNAIREQALLLCASIRRFGGRYRDAPILAFAPRAGLGVDAATAQALAAMDVDYVDRPLNTLCPEYGSANRVFAAAWAETHASADFMIVLDSDTVFLDEPELPVEADVAVRPVDAKGSATAGPDDPFDAYWTTLARLGGTSLDRLPFLRTTIGSVRIRASYNGGLVVARRDRGLLGRWADLFARSVTAGLRPYRGTGTRIYASTGDVGQAASEYWGSNQAALALTIWAGSDRVVYYPASYNVPLHLLAAEAEIDDAWLASPPVHVHYHRMFGVDLRDAAVEMLARLNVGADRLEWLAQRTPLGEH